MKPWSLLGILLVLGSIVPLVLMRHTSAASTPAATWMIGFSGELDRYARAHENRYPESFGDLLADGSAPHAAHPIDPWNHPYVYERHLEDPQRCRVYTLGDPRSSDSAKDDSTLAMYRIAGLTLWRERLDDVPAEWRAPVLSGAPRR